jgi:hypothetical protein
MFVLCFRFSRPCLFNDKWIWGLTFVYKPVKLINSLSVCLPCLMKDQVWSKNSLSISYMTCFHIAYSSCHILGALSYSSPKRMGKPHLNWWCNTQKGNYLIVGVGVRMLGKPIITSTRPQQIPTCHWIKLCHILILAHGLSINIYMYCSACNRLLGLQ